MRILGYCRSRCQVEPLPPIVDRFGLRSFAQVKTDFATVVQGALRRERFLLDLKSAGLLRPDLSLPAYAGLVPEDGLVPIVNLFDRSSGPEDWYRTRVSRSRCRDFRGGRLCYDDHDGTDLVCPIGIPALAAAPGTVVLVRDYWLRAGLVVGIDHGHGTITHCAHLSRADVTLGQIVKRGEQIGLSGACGYDLVQFFPWVPPHIHFEVFVWGRSVDPFARAGEESLWLCADDPQPSGPLPDEVVPKLTPVDQGAVKELVDRCEGEFMRQELCARQGYLPGLAAFLEDAIEHHLWAWPKECWGASVRPAGDREKEGVKVKLSLPLPEKEYRGTRFADRWWTRP